VQVVWLLRLCGVTLPTPKQFDDPNTTLQVRRSALACLQNMHATTPRAHRIACCVLARHARVQGIVQGLRSLGFAGPAYAPTQLVPGWGREVVGLLDALLDAVLQARGLAALPRTVLGPSRCAACGVCGCQLQSRERTPCSCGWEVACTPIPRRRLTHTRALLPAALMLRQRW
jgi:hypothetical protein